MTSFKKGHGWLAPPSDQENRTFSFVQPPYSSISTNYLVPWSCNCMTDALRGGRHPLDHGGAKPATSMRRLHGSRWCRESNTNFTSCKGLHSESFCNRYPWLPWHCSVRSPCNKRRIARRVHRVARLTRGCQQRVTGAPNPPFCPREYYIPTPEDPSSDQRQEASRTIGVSRLEAYLLWKSLARRSKIASWQLGEEQRGSSERPITSAAT